MFAELVGRFDALDAPMRDFMQADMRTRKAIVAASIRAGTISPFDLDKVFEYNVIVPSSDLGAVAILASRRALCHVVLRRVKRGWEMLPTLFELPRACDTAGARTSTLISTLSRQLERHGAGVRLHGCMHPRSAAVLRAVHWKSVGNRRMDAAEMAECAWKDEAHRPAGCGASCPAPHERRMELAVHSLRQTMVDRAGKLLDDMLANQPTCATAAMIAVDWTREVALRRASRPEHARFFAAVERHACAGAVSARVASAMVDAYVAHHPGSYAPATAGVSHADCTVQWPCCRLTQLSCSALLSSWGGALFIAYKALWCCRIDWFVCALRVLMLAPSSLERDGARRRVATAVAKLSQQKQSAFLATVVALLVVAGCGVGELNDAARSSAVGMHNTWHVAGCATNRDAIASIAATSDDAAVVLLGLVRDGVLCGTRRLPAVFLSSVYGAAPRLSMASRAFAARLKLPVVNASDRKTMVVAGAALARCKFPPELISIILSCVRPTRDVCGWSVGGDMPMTYIRGIIY